MPCDQKLRLFSRKKMAIGGGMARLQIVAEVDLSDLLESLPDDVAAFDGIFGELNRAVWWPARAGQHCRKFEC